ncbi:uncharacterized protein LOC123310552 [Coccinella septempunctata]|uniref:uncharacterized protein LOC123310552 n=1 Tax=Coccinella septempunctata TaxID=41139 RepID=UPI001D06A3AE|nr:uncharacterized protein LOC123310552 [Coccinella septempunctata]
MALHVLYQNVRGLRTKLHTFKMNVTTYSFDVIMVTESWLNEGVLDSEVVDDQYTIKRDGGGVFVIVRNGLNADRLLDFESGAEDIWLKIKVNKKNVYMCCVYIAPGNDEAYSMFVSKLESIKARIRDSDVLLICGDFNCPSLG